MSEPQTININNVVVGKREGAMKDIGSLES